jgi:hypothetical protein
MWASSSLAGTSLASLPLFFFIFGTPCAVQHTFAPAKAAVTVHWQFSTTFEEECPAARATTRSTPNPLSMKSFVLAITVP